LRCMHKSDWGYRRVSETFSAILMETRLFELPKVKNDSNQTAIVLDECKTRWRGISPSKTLGAGA
jgi:hypothetical protein